MKINRREFIKSLAAMALLSAIPIPAFCSTREPYVFVGDIVSHIGPSPGGFIGGQSVKFVGKWDGVGFPVTLYKNDFRQPRSTEIYYDIDLSCMERELPDKFWHNPDNQKYPNVHTWIRMQRYGETMQDAIIKMNLASSEQWLKAL